MIYQILQTCLMGFVGGLFYGFVNDRYIQPLKRKRQRSKLIEAVTKHLSDLNKCKI